MSQVYFSETHARFYTDSVCNLSFQEHLLFRKTTSGPSLYPSPNFTQRAWTGRAHTHMPLQTNPPHWVQNLNYTASHSPAQLLLRLHGAVQSEESLMCDGETNQTCKSGGMCSRHEEKVEQKHKRLVLLNSWWNKGFNNKTSTHALQCAVNLQTYSKTTNSDVQIKNEASGVFLEAFPPVTWPTAFQILESWLCSSSPKWHLPPFGRRGAFFPPCMMISLELNT